MILLPQIQYESTSNTFGLTIHLEEVEIEIDEKEVGDE